MDPQQLIEVERLCQTAYTSENDTERNEAEQKLAVFTQSDSLRQCQAILDHSGNPYALHLACRSIKSLVTDHWHQFSDRVPDIRKSLSLRYVRRLFFGQ